MVANIRGYTPNYSFKLVNFDTPRWHTLEYANWTQLDSLLLQSGIPAVRGDWQHSTQYLVGDRVFDTETVVLYRCLVTHTSAAGGTFADDRAAHPTYWTLQTFGVPLFRGAWSATTTYALGDIVFVGLYAYYLCVTNHTSGTSFPPDAGKWVLVFDATAAVTTTTDNANASAVSANSAATSASEAANYKVAAGISADAASASAAAAAISETNAQTSATNAATSATNSANSAIISAQQAAALRGTSVTPNTLALGTKVFETQSGKQFNVGNFITIVDAANIANVLGGQISAYSGTTLTVNITKASGIGTISNWNLYISGSVGLDGIPGTTTITASPTAPVSPPDGTLWWDTVSGMLYVRYNDGTSVQWVTAVPIPDTTKFVSVDAQTLTAAQQAQARANIYAAPFDAMAYNGMQINGAMEVSQERGSNPITDGHVCDGWLVQSIGGMVVSAATLLHDGLIPGIPQMLTYTTPTAKPALAVGDLVRLYQTLEGIRLSRLGWGTPSAKPITISFWSCHTKVGLYTVGVANVGAARSYVTTYTQTVANIPEYHTVTIPGDTTGTWPKDITLAMYLSFTTAAGSSFTAPAANVWTAGAFFAAPGQVNAASSTSDVVRITGVVVLPGIEAPTAAQSPLIMRPFAQELLTCQRYYWTSFPHGTVVGTGKGMTNCIYGACIGDPNFGTPLLADFHVPMRVVPTVSTYNPVSANTAVRNFATNLDCANLIVSPPSMNRIVIVAYGTNTQTIGHGLGVHAVADARL